MTTSTSKPFEPSNYYTYTALSAEDTKNYVQENAGASVYSVKQ